MKHFFKQYEVVIFVLFFSFTAGPVQGEGLADEFEGLIEPCELVYIGTPVEGVVEHVNVKRSSIVEKGEILINLESSVERAVVERSLALTAVEGEIKLQTEQLAFSRRMHTRVKELFNSDAISAEKKDQSATEVTMARARLLKAKENRNLARLDLERAQAMLAQRTIKSPISGVVVERFVSPGEFVDNQPLLKIAQLDPLRVEVILPAEMFRKIKPGMKADINPENPANGSRSATVAIVDRVIDPASGTFGVRLELPNPDYQLPGGLKCTVQFLDETETVSPAETTSAMETDKVAKVSSQKPTLSTVVQ